jgi:glycosyltransferase involved in cell wall biosynthesis
MRRVDCVTVLFTPVRCDRAAQRDRVKLGVVTTSYPQFAGDPAGGFVAGHVGALRALGHDVEVIAAGAPDDGRGAPGDRAVLRSAGAQRLRSSRAPDARDADDDAAVIRLAGSRLFYRGGAPDALERAPLRTGLDAAAFTARMMSAVTARARRWDAIIAHWLVPSAIAALPSALPLIAIAHGGDVFTLHRLRLLRLVLHALHRRDARLVFVSEHLRTLARDVAPAIAPWLGRALVQPMGIDLARFAALERTPSTPPTVLIAARLVPIKGVDVAIAAMRHVRTTARLVIAGDGPERARLAARGGDPVTGEERTGTAWPPAPTFLGQVTTAQRDVLLRTAGVVVIPSRVLPNGRVEGTPVIAVEALAAGVPVVASAVGGLVDLPGIRLVPPDDPCELARAIDRTLADPPSPEALRAGVATLDWREVAPRLLRG